MHLHTPLKQRLYTCTRELPVFAIHATRTHRSLVVTKCALRTDAWNAEDMHASMCGRNSVRCKQLLMRYVHGKHVPTIETARTLMISNAHAACNVQSKNDQTRRDGWVVTTLCKYRLVYCLHLCFLSLSLHAVRLQTASSSA